MNYKLSPSDLTFGYQGCKRCFYLKVVNGISQPSIPLPMLDSPVSAMPLVRSSRLGGRRSRAGSVGFRVCAAWTAAPSQRAPVHDSKVQPRTAWLRARVVDRGTVIEEAEMESVAVRLTAPEVPRPVQITKPVPHGLLLR